MQAKNSLFWIQVGAVCGGLAVILGAFAAHGLGPYLMEKYGEMNKEVLGQQVPASVKYLADFKTAAEYQMSHALALIAVGLLSLHYPSNALKIAGRSFFLGIVLFSGSLYLLVLSGVTILGAITPLGGLAFITGWGALFYAVATIDPHPHLQSPSE